MELTENIIRSLIKEEIEKNLIVELTDVEQEAVTQIVATMSRLDASGSDAIGTVTKAIAKFKTIDSAQASSPLNRKDINEMGCGDMQSIDMGVDTHSDHDADHEDSMAKRQMFKTAEYATAIFDMIQDGEEFPAWIQSKMTKIADYIGAVKHYLEYDHVMGEAKLTKKQIKGRDDDAKSIMKSTKKQYGKEEGESAAYAIATNIQKEKAKKK